MRTLAIDLGSKRIGLALSDQGGSFASPFDVLQVSAPELAMDPIRQVIEREGVERVVIGLPLNMDGSLGPQAKQTIAWVESFSVGLRPGLSIIYVDERLSSFAAEQQIVERKRAGEKITRKSKKAQLDAVAAAGFLQGFLDGSLPAIDIDARSKKSIT